MKNIFALAVTLSMGFAAMSQSAAPAATANSGKTSEKKACCAKAEKACCAKAASCTDKKSTSDKAKAETPAVQRKNKARVSPATKDN